MLSLAVASIYFALYQLQWFDFMNQLKEFLYETVLIEAITGIQKVAPEQVEIIRDELIK